MAIPQGYTFDPKTGNFIPSAGYYNPSSPSFNAFNPDRYKNNPFDINSTNSAERRRAQDYRDSVDRAQMDQAGKPNLPEFQSALNENGSVKDVYRLGAPPVNRNPLNSLENYSMSTDQSPWLKLALEKNQEQTQQGVSNALTQNASQAATARGNLAMRGGLSSGARERLAKTEMQGGNYATQGAYNTGNQNEMNLKVQEEQDKLNTLKALPQAELAYGQQEQDANKFNIQNALNDILQKRAYDVGGYNEAMRAWAAGKTADAQSGGGKK